MPGVPGYVLHWSDHSQGVVTYAPPFYQAVRQLETHGSRDYLQVPRNDHTLPQLTVAFEVVPHNDGSVHCEFLPRSSIDEVRYRDNKAIRILSETEHVLTLDALSVSMAVTRIVIPVDGVRPRVTIHSLPTELLIKIFDSTDSCECRWQYELLSFAQVCHQWSRCCIQLLFARLESEEWKKNRRFSQLHQSLNPWGFAKALSDVPALGLDFRHLDIDQYHGSPQCRYHVRRQTPGFVQALFAILRATKNLQSLHLSLGHSSQANPRFLALPRLPHLHTLTITRAFNGYMSFKYSRQSANAFQLACCMTRWTGLTSLTVEDLGPGNIGVGRFFLRPPACALTQLCIRNSPLSDKDLLYLTASSAKTLTQVTLEYVSLEYALGITGDGLYTFLRAISQNVVSLTIRIDSFGGPNFAERSHVLDDVVDKMWCLRELYASGDIASERMLRRRSEMFVRSCGSGVPVVLFSFEHVPKIRNRSRNEWAGWELVDIRD